jgi:hypothetical protein
MNVWVLQTKMGCPDDLLTLHFASMVSRAPCNISSEWKFLLIQDWYLYKIQATSLSCQQINAEYRFLKTPVWTGLPTFCIYLDTFVGCLNALTCHITFVLETVWHSSLMATRVAVISSTIHLQWYMMLHHSFLVPGTRVSWKDWWTPYPPGLVEINTGAQGPEGAMWEVAAVPCTCPGRSEALLHHH